MKKRVRFGILLLLMIMMISVWADQYHYRQMMDSVEIIHFITGSGSGYSTVYLVAVVPADEYHGEDTLEAVWRYVTDRNKEVPDVLQIILYESMEKLREGKSYVEDTIRR